MIRLYDVIIIVRGGGVRFDLVVFDDYELCVAVVECLIFVLIGIGYEIDEVLFDLVVYIVFKIFMVVVEWLIDWVAWFES